MAGRPKKEILGNEEVEPLEKHEVTKEEKESATQNMLGSLLKGYKDDHYNFINGENFRVSTGSLLMDQYIHLSSGCHRLVGSSTSGKTSEGLLIVKNYLETVKNSKGIYIPAEGRLSEVMQQRSGLKFVYDSEEWKIGTVFVLESNIFETVCDILEGLFKTAFLHEEKIATLIDSMDALIPRDSKDNKSGEIGRVAGPAALMKRFLAKMTLPINKYGFLCLVTSQVSSDIKINPYSKELPKMTSGSGGWGLVHFANYILEFEPRYQSNFILENPKEKPDPIKNKILGHWVSVLIKKSDNETEGIRIEYPIKHGRLDGKSIWIEYEVADIMLAWEQAKQSGPSILIDESIIKELKDNNLEIPEKFVGIDKFRAFLEDNQPITTYLFNKFKNILSKE